MRRAPYAPFVLAISPSPRGFAFVLFSRPTTPFDWGIKDIRGDDKNAACLAAITKLFRSYRPSTLVTEDAEARESRRGQRIRMLLRSTSNLAAREEIVVHRYPREEVRRTFVTAGARTRPEIAQVIAARIPALAPRLPPVRKIWMSEDRRQSLFDAAALGITFFAHTRRDA